MRYYGDWLLIPMVVVFLGLNLALIAYGVAGLEAKTPVPCACRPVDGKPCDCCTGCRGRN